MGCDIHLRLEIKLRRDKKWGDLVLESAGVWMSCNIFSFRNTWGDRVPAMFSRLTGGSGIDSEPIPLRGFPVDCCEATLQCYGLLVSDIFQDKYPAGIVSRAEADEWVSSGVSSYYKVEDREYVSCSDYHSANWCTTQEMANCIYDAFIDGDGHWQGDYVEWCALLGAMLGYEKSGEYVCRAVFWFDN